MKRLVRFCSYYSESLKKSLADAGIKYEWTQEKPDPYQVKLNTTKQIKTKTCKTKQTKTKINTTKQNPQVQKSHLNFGVVKW